MIEIMDLVILGLVSGFTALLVSSVAAYVLHERRNKDVNNLAARVESLEMSIRGAMGRANRAENDAETQAAIAEAMALIQSGKAPMDVLKELAPKYPKAIMNLAKKFGFNI